MPYRNRSGHAKRRKPKSIGDLERAREYARLWRVANPDRVKAQSRRYYEANGERIREKHRLYREANGDHVREAERRRRMKGATACRIDSSELWA
jgi:hypothetical protein